MTMFPGSPRLQKGAIICLDPTNSLASVIMFQYNPDWQACIVRRDKEDKLLYEFG